MLLLAALEHSGTGNDANNGHNRNSTDDNHGVVARLGQGLTGRLLARLGLVARLGVGRLGIRRLGSGLILIPLGVERYRGGKRKLIARGIACAGAVLCGVPAHEGVALAHRLIGRDLSLGNVLDGSKFSGPLSSVEPFRS